ncbi:hypothetical protein GF386_03345 [Candidatus Pacearchaeota archaeon]|nr:hypothetical protein [Candidatus Pacearchaeota archaeon]MBD3283175.1 hypothetical protein [Candidatus Pacearchaeota archaeon]
MKKRNLMTLSIFLMILSVSFVSSFGVATNYWKGHPMQLSPGESGTSVLSLQNMKTTEDLTVQMDITKGDEIASIDKSRYFVKANTADTVVPVKIRIPYSAEPGTVYEVTVSSRTVTPGGSGVVLGTGMDTSFEVLVVENVLLETESEEIPQLKFDTGVLIGALVIVVILGVLLWVFLKKKKKSK